MENIIELLDSQGVNYNDMAIRKLTNYHKLMEEETNFSGEFCLFDGNKKSIDRIIPSKRGAIMVSLCTKCMGRTDEEILDVISDKL